MGIGWVLLGVLQGNCPFRPSNPGCMAACSKGVSNPASKIAFFCRPICSQSTYESLKKSLLPKSNPRATVAGPRDCPAIYLKRRELTYVLDHTALNRRLKFKEDYVHERHCCGSRREGKGRRIIVIDGGLKRAIEDKSERNVIDDY
jgi:hypothetical protein